VPKVNYSQRRVNPSPTVEYVFHPERVHHGSIAPRLSVTDRRWAGRSAGSPWPWDIGDIAGPPVAPTHPADQPLRYCTAELRGDHVASDLRYHLWTMSAPALPRSLWGDLASDATRLPVKRFARRQRLFSRDSALHIRANGVTHSRAKRRALTVKSSMTASMCPSSFIRRLAARRHGNDFQCVVPILYGRF